jgi:hypothetical protein
MKNPTNAARKTWIIIILLLTLLLVLSASPAFAGLVWSG